MTLPYQSDIVARLQGLKHSRERPLFPIALPKADEDAYLPLIRSLYNTSATDVCCFYEQDKDGFPTETIPTTVADETFYPTLTLTNTFDVAKWKNVPKPRYYSGTWPPTSIEHLIGSPSQTESCLWDYDGINCGCTYSSTVERLYNFWTENLLVGRLWSNQWRVYTRATLDPETVLGEYTGELVPVNPKETDADCEYKVSISIGEAKGSRQGGSQPTCHIDATRSGSIFRFLGHSCNPNAKLMQARVGKERRVIAVITTRSIGFNQEVTIDYGDGWFKDGLKCHCGTAECRNPDSSATPNPNKRQRTSRYIDSSRKHRDVESA